MEIHGEHLNLKTISNCEFEIKQNIRIICYGLISIKVVNVNVFQKNKHKHYRNHK